MIFYVMAEVKIIDETHVIAEKRGNGKLRREVWVDRTSRQVTRYNLAYINHRLFSGDHGRVVGYDNAHDGHHRHYFGKMQSVDFVSFESTEALFEQDWLACKEQT
jgi:hypothetical protein